jgi:GNAT superfamily N-acetyltransferase
MQLPLATRIYHFLKGPNPLHPKIWNGRLSPLNFRQVEPTDVPQCLELYDVNEPGRFPEGVRQDYETCLVARRSYMLVAEKNGRLVASGGLHYLRRRDVATLCYGLVHPDFHRMGIGTALVLTRLALLKSDEPSYRVFIAAVAKSMDFYRRFGFVHHDYWQDKHGQLHPTGLLMFTSGEIRECRELLASQGISYPADEDQVPFHEKLGESR